MRRRLKAALLGLLALLSQCTGGCVDTYDQGAYVPDTDALTDIFVERWEVVDGEPVAGDFRDALRFWFVDGSAWHPKCGDPMSLRGCAVWDGHAYIYHLQIELGLPPDVTDGIVFHELAHAALRHHYGTTDPEHERSWAWVDVVGHLGGRRD